MSFHGGDVLAHYRLLDKVGEGGMGVVWKAEDLVLGRIVAIKVLRPEVSGDPKRRSMFLDEARLAGQVNSQHVVQVHEFGSEAGLDFIVMEYVEGRPLSQLLRGRRLPADRVAAIGSQVAKAISNAHRKGLLHRDLKPSNILVTPDGDVKVADFGLATLLARLPPPLDAEGPTLTSVVDEPTRTVSSPWAEGGPLVGTISYMSPEQARGEELDARSDVFSLGIVLYEMTSGVRPFVGASSAEVLREIVRDRPAPVHEMTSKVPLDLHRIIQKALAKHRADRYQTMDDLAVDLKRLGQELESGSSPSFQDLAVQATPHRRRWTTALTIASLLTAGGLVLLWTLTGKESAPGAPLRTVLVLPMEVRGQAQGKEYAGQSFSEAMALNLAQAGGVSVLPVPGQGRFNAASKEGLDQAERELGASLLVTGALNREASSVNAVVSVIDVRTHRIVCGAQEGAPDGDLARLASSVTARLVGQLGLPTTKRYDYFRYVSWTPQMAAFPGLPEAVLALRQHDIATGLAATQRLIDSFPSEYDAHLMRFVALIDANNADPSRRRHDAVADELAAIEKIDPKSPILELFAGFRIEEHSGLIDRLTRLLLREDLTPAFRSHVLRERARLQMSDGDWETAVEGMNEAIRLDPANAWNYAYSSQILTRSQQLEEAVTRAGQAVALEPTYTEFYLNLGGILGQMADWPRAVSAYRTACEGGHTQRAWALHSLALVRSGDRPAALEVGRKAITKQETAEGSYFLAVFWGLMDDRETSQRLLKRSLELGLNQALADSDGNLAFMRGDPEYERVVAALQRMMRPES